MNTWSRNGDSDFESFGFHVKLAPTMWYTAMRSDRTGYDLGGHVDLAQNITKAIEDNDAFLGYAVSRRAARTMFVPEILITDEVMPEYLTTAERIGALALGKDYDLFISFETKNEATLFKMSFRGDVNVGFDGVN